MFVVDESGSIGNTYYNNLKNYITDVVNLLAPSSRGHHVGLVSFSSLARLQFKFDYSQLPNKVPTNQPVLNIDKRQAEPICFFHLTRLFLKVFKNISVDILPLRYPQSRTWGSQLI